MATSEDLVPTGRAYGERQKTRAAMRQADLPLSSAGATEQAPAVGGGLPSQVASLPTGGGAFSPLDMLASRSPADFMFLSDPEQQAPAAQPASEPESPMAALAASAQSTFAAAVLSRLTGR